ncbi:MAG: DUF4097 family beta strand repeat-containing protein [Anaerocolumna sp.]
MNEFQKVIKYLAIAFAIFLTVTIVTGIASGIVALVGVTTVSKEDVVNYNESFDNVRSLLVEHGVGKLIIKSTDSDKITVEGNQVTESFAAEKSLSGELRIKSKFNFWNMFGSTNTISKNTSITIYLPKDFTAEIVELNAGAGNVLIESLVTEKLEINAGVGDVYGEYIFADKVSLDGGVGDITLENAQLNDVDIDAGVGNIDIEGKLTGDNDISAGVGNIKLDIIGSTDDYNMNIEKGVGDIYINGEKHGDLNWNNRTAKYSMEMDGGVGNIRINFTEQ